MNKFCTSCGKELGGAKFCPNCGAPAEPAESKQNASIIGGGAKTNKGNVVNMGFLIAYLVLMLLSCIDFSAPILDNIYSIKFYEIPMLIFKWSRYIYSNDVKTIFILVCIVASIAEICMAVISIRGLIKVFTTDESAVSSMHGASSGAITLSAVVMVSTFIIKAMLNSAPGSNYIRYGNVISLSGTTVFLLILGIIGAVVASKLEDPEGSPQIQGQTISEKAAEERTGECELCGKKDVPVREVVINDEYWGELHRNACEECIAKRNSEKAEEKIKGEINE